MILLSRAMDESIVIQNNFLLTVSEIQTAQIRINLAERVRGGRISFADSIESTLNVGETLSLLNGASVSLKEVSNRKAVLAFHGLAGDEVCRKEVYDIMNGLSDI